MDTKEAVDSYTVTTGTFSGPFELLLELIESHKLFINEISLAEVTNEYVNYLKTEKGLDMQIATNFILIAATLILIKSRSLLPNLKLTEEEAESITSLEARLKLYQIIKDISPSIQEKFGKQIIFSAPTGANEHTVFSPHDKITKSALEQAIQDVLRALPKKEILPEVTVRKVMNIEELIDSLTLRMTQAVNVSFKSFTNEYKTEDSKEAKMFTIVTFLAMLELVRSGLIDVLQSNLFDDMTITKDMPQQPQQYGNN
jgi:segregation and condensation protein A